MFSSDEKITDTANSRYYDGNYESSKLKTLTIFGGGNSKSFNTLNSNGGVCEPIVRKLYQAYKGTRTYKIGTINDNKSETVYEPGEWHGVQYNNWDEDAYRKYFSVVGDANVRKTRDEIAERNEFASKIIDLGVMITDPASGLIPHYRSSTQVINSGAAVKLPSTTKFSMFSSETDAVFKRDFEITWTTFDDTAVSGTVADGYITINPTATSGKDTYIVYVGTIAETSYKFYYPVLVAGSTQVESGRASYRSFTDPQFRLFVYLASGSNDPTVSTAITSLDAESGRAAEYRSLYSGIASLDGIEVFTGLETLNIPDNHIADCSALSGLTSLTSVKLNNNLISSVSWARSLTSLTTLELSNNVIKTTHDGMTYFPASLKTLKLDGNDCISVDDIDKMTTLTELDVLWLNNTAVSGDAAVLDALISVLGATNSVSLKLSNATAISVTAADLAIVKIPMTQTLHMFIRSSAQRADTERIVRPE